MRQVRKYSGTRSEGCPKCTAAERSRLKRRGAWTWLPFTRHYLCRRCHTRYAVMAGRLRIVLNRGFG
ncbi:hypothetical protein [Kiritimatiella glycovorans]|uniref:Uncharacterized protein n=1 Tax=Kiritimatiella glycovorans TaxID=1307763 RepID=A0A0G3EIR0_9BACT|nr:hypothetical protein [Kiritimatiella glycovorans]AKJ64049.1 hypothetical protein L21SP4_00784 [Kiritimatiella glycovorans]